MTIDFKKIFSASSVEDCENFIVFASNLKELIETAPASVKKAIVLKNLNETICDAEAHLLANEDWCNANKEWL